MSAWRRGFFRTQACTQHFRQCAVGDAFHFRGEIPLAALPANNSPSRKSQPRSLFIKLPATPIRILNTYSKLLLIIHRRSATIGSTLCRPACGKPRSKQGDRYQQKGNAREGNCVQGLSPKSVAESARETPAEARIPIAMPERIGRNPSLITSCSTWIRSAPSAMRIPISGFAAPRFS